MKYQKLRRKENVKKEHNDVKRNTVKKEHNDGASWLDDVRKRTSDVKKQYEIEISIDDVEMEVRKTANWKAPDPDGVRGFWFNKFKSLHNVIANGLNSCLECGKC